MSAADVGTVWSGLGARLRGFVARRVAPTDVEDVLQEVFLKLHRSIGTVRDDQRLIPWILRVTRNVIADRARSAARRPRDAELGEIAAPEEDPRDLLQDELEGCLADFVARLPPAYREAITPVELQGLSQKEAAELLGISHAGMRSRVQRGRAQLREMFECACGLALDGRRRVVECQPRPGGGCRPATSPGIS